MASEYIRAMEGEPANCDSMILISLCYGKQVGVFDARNREEAAGDSVGTAFDDAVTLNDVEQYKHLLPYDLGLRESDGAYHSPLLTYATLRVFKNMRIRNQSSDEKRRRKWSQKSEQYAERREDRRTERRERHDDVPPLQKYSHRHIGGHCSRSAARVAPQDLTSRRPPPPPPAPEGQSTTSDSDTTTPPLRIKAPPPHMKGQLQPRSPPGPSPVKAPPVKAPPVPSSRSARSPSPAPYQPSKTVRPSGSTPPWREPEHRRGTGRGRESTRYSDERDTRTRTGSRSAGGHWTNTRTAEPPAPPVPVPPPPPPPPPRMSGSEWLNQRSEPASSSSYRSSGQYYQQPYWRTNQQRNTVEYVPGYYTPHERWARRPDGAWLD